MFIRCDVSKESELKYMQSLAQAMKKAHGPIELVDIPEDPEKRERVFGIIASIFCDATDRISWSERNIWRAHRKEFDEALDLAAVKKNEVEGSAAANTNKMKRW